MKLLRASVLSACVFFSTFAYSQTYEWAKSFGGSENIFSRSIKADKEGNIYITGNFIGTVDLDPGTSTAYLTSNGLRDVFIAKYDWDGNYLWAGQIGGASNDLGIALDVDNNSNVYFTGSYEGTVDLNPGDGVYTLPSSGGTLFVCKLNKNGDFQWAQRIQGAKNIDETTSIEVIGQENVQVVGVFYWEILIDDQILEYKNDVYDGVYIAIFDQEGNVADAQVINSADDLEFDAGPGGRVYYAGILQSSENNTRLYTYFFYNNMIAVGNSRAELINFPGEMRLSGIATDQDQNVYIAGEFKAQNVDFDPSENEDIASSSGIYADAFILKLDSLLQHEWSLVIPGNLSFGIRDIALDSKDNLYLTGGFTGTIQLGGIDLTATNNYNDIFIAKYNKGGGLLWAESFGSTSGDVGECLTLDDYDDLYVTGSFRESVDFDPAETFNELTSLGKADVFILQFLQCSTPDLNVEVNGDTLAAVTADVSYQWLDCSDNYSPVDGATDHNFIPERSGVYALQIINGKCIDTTGCYELVKTGIANLSSSYTIYPNPSDGNINIQLGQLTEWVNIELLDISGKLYLSKRFVNVSNLSLSVDIKPGTYFLRLITPSNTTYSKIIFRSSAFRF